MVMLPWLLGWVSACTPGARAKFPSYLPARIWTARSFFSQKSHAWGGWQCRGPFWGSFVLIPNQIRNQMKIKNIICRSMGDPVYPRAFQDAIPT